MQDSNDKTRNLLAILIVGSFIFTSGLIALLPYLVGLPAAEYTDHLKTFVSLFTGIVGFILGYYFKK